MNVEMFFVRTDSIDSLLPIIADRLNSPSDPHGQQPNWGLESSYDVVISPARKRKLIISPPDSGWVAAIESSETLDFGLLQRISKALKTDVIGIQLSDAIGACGYAHSSEGILQETFYSEEEDDPYRKLLAFLRVKGIPYGILSFREVVQLRQKGWFMVSSGELKQ